MGYKNDRAAVNRMERDAELLLKHHVTLAARAVTSHIPNNESTTGTFVPLSNESPSFGHDEHDNEASDVDLNNSSFLSSIVDSEDDDKYFSSSHDYNIELGDDIIFADILRAVDFQADHRPFLADHENVHFSTTESAMIEIYSFSLHHGTSLSFIDNFLVLLRKLSKDGFDVSRSPSCRKFFLKNLRKKMGNHASPIPTSVKVPSSTLIVPKFSLMDQRMDIVSSPTFQDINNLVVNGDPKTRFHKYITPIGQEQLKVHSARWYQETYDMMVTNPETDLLFPIQIYTDATPPTDAMQRFPLEPVMFTTTLLKRSEREKSGSWRHLGFIPPCDDPAATPEQAMQWFHDCLNVILTTITTGNWVLFGRRTDEETPFTASCIRNGRSAIPGQTLR
jgi:hypothetical protein